MQMQHPDMDDISMIGLLRGTLWHLQHIPEFRQDDPAVVYIKRNLLRSIAELELESESTKPDEPIGMPRVH